MKIASQVLFLSWGVGFVLYGWFVFDPIWCVVGALLCIAWSLELEK